MRSYPLLQFLAAADKQGRVTFSTEDTDFEGRAKDQSLPDFYATQVLRLMTDFAVFTLPFEKAKSSFKALDIQAVPEKSTRHYLVSFNLTKMLRLPGVHPAEELRELATLIEGFKSFYLENAAFWPRLAVRNHRDSGKRTYGTFEFMIDGFPTSKKVAKAATEQLMQQVERSPVLSSWLRQMALDLNKAGPSKWFVFTGEHFFRDVENPCIQEKLKWSPELTSAAYSRSRQVSAREILAFCVKPAPQRFWFYELA